MAFKLANLSGSDRNFTVDAWTASNSYRISVIDLGAGTQRIVARTVSGDTGRILGAPVVDETRKGTVSQDDIREIVATLA